VLQPPVSDMFSGYMRLVSLRLHSVPLPLWLLFLLILTASCSDPATIGLSIEPEAQEIWQSLLEKAPLPPEIVLGSEGPVLVHLYSTVGPMLSGRSPGSTVIERTWLAATAALWDFPAQAGPGSELVPLSLIELPSRALALDGLYPNHRDYPAVEELYLQVLEPDVSSIPRASREPLLQWLESLRAAADTLAAAVPPEPPEVVWIAGVGDIMLERGMAGLLLRDGGLELVFSDVLPIMLEADLLLGNLEGALSRQGTPLAKGFTFRFDPGLLEPLARAGFDYLSVVNNHSYDYGEIAFLDSIDFLAASPIGTSGAGRTLAEASQPWIAQVGNTEVRVIGAGAYPLERSGFDGARTTVATQTRPGVLWAGPRNPAAQEQMFAAMEAAFSPESFNIVSIHGGAEWATAPEQWQRELYRDLIDRGADLVLGHHSHVVQGLEAHRGGLIAHSLGNFVFPGMFATEYGEQSVVLRVGVVDGAIRYVEPVPVTIDHQLLGLDRGDALLDRMSQGTRILQENR